MKFVLEPNNRGASDQIMLDDLRKVARNLGKDFVTKDEYEQDGRFSSFTIPFAFGSSQVVRQRAVKCANMKGETMRKEYDFSQGERGKFYKRGAKLNLPVYLDSDVREFVEKIAEDKQSDVSTVVNQLLKSDKKLADAMQ